MQQGLGLSGAAVNPPRRLQVLLVEDDLMVARTIVRQLNRYDLEVTHAASSQEVTRLEGQFAVGIFDLNLPGASGVEVARLCASRGVVEHLVFFSGTPDDDHVEAARALGEFIEKGCGISTLLRRVTALAASWDAPVLSSRPPRTPTRPAQDHAERPTVRPPCASSVRAAAE
jgi:DNA-binding response OmpR family regulator